MGERADPSPADAPLSARDYLQALINEHDYLRDEIKSTIASRNAAFLAFAAAAIAAVVKIFPLHHLSSFSSRFVATGLLPTLFFGIAVLQAGAMARTSRAGLVVAVVEEKVRLLFADASLADAKLIPALTKLNSNLARSLKSSARDWSEPFLWERLVRASGRFFNSSWLRNHAIMGLAAGLSVVGPAVLYDKSALGRSALTWSIVAYLVLAEASAIWLSSRFAFGDWKSLEKFAGAVRAAPPATNVVEVVIESGDDRQSRPTSAD